MALAGQHAFVTGGGRGIGRAVAAALARAGATVTVIGRTEAPLREAVEAGDAAGCGIADVTDVVEVKREVSAAEAARGPIAILVNNAGSVESGAFVRADPAVFRTMWNVHLMGAVYASQAVLPGMVERGFGRIVNVASTAGLKGYPYVSAYCAAKHALVGLPARSPPRPPRAASPSTRCAPAIPTPSWCATASTASPTRPAARRRRCSRNTRRTHRSAA